MRRALVLLSSFLVHCLSAATQRAVATRRAQSRLNSIRCDHVTFSTEPFIGNDVFWDYANVTYNPNVELNTFPGIRIFLHAEDIAPFSVHSQRITDPFVLITRSNLDAVVPYHSSGDKGNLSPAYTAILKHPHLIQWFASNKVLRHPKLTGLPLGPKWQWHSTAFHGEDSTKGALLRVLTQHASNAHSNFYDVHKPALLFMSMTESSSDNAMYAPWRGSRRDAVHALQANFPVMHEPRYNINQDKLVGVGPCTVRRDSEEYLLKMQHYRFVLSPPGNGPDTHRTWEALLMGCVPVVISGPFDELYTELPVLVLKSWGELTPDRLKSAYAELRYGQHAFAFEKLYTRYWYDLIDRTIETALI